MAVDQTPMHRLKADDDKLAPDSAGTVTNKLTVTPPSGCTDGDILYKRDRGHPLRFWVLDSRLAPLSSLPSG